MGRIIRFDVGKQFNESAFVFFDNRRSNERYAVFQSSPELRPGLWLGSDGKLSDSYRVPVADLPKRERKLYRQNVIPDETQRALGYYEAKGVSFNKA
ncbi:MAG: hypothetical protein KDK08_28855 [Rhizobiaceae bacterium]|nr:hypothetical protein [Rhizobiaceae bacterium]